MVYKIKKILFGSIFLILAFSFLGAKTEYTLTCDKATSLCEYKTASLIKSTPKTERTYNLSSFKSVEYSEYKTTQRTRRGGTRTKTHYEAVIFVDGDAIVFPVKFSNAETAMAQVEKFGQYISSDDDEQYYTYTKKNGSLLIVGLIILFAFLAYNSFRSAFGKEKIKPEKKEQKVEEKKESTVEKK